MIGWLLSFALVVIFLLFMKDFIRLLFSGIGAFFILGVVYLGWDNFATLVIVLNLIIWIPLIISHIDYKSKQFH